MKRRLRLRLNWRDLLARAPLPMLALAASWGVYSFAALYVPQEIAIIQAAAFELTYIGLAVTRDLSDRQRRRATAISVGAVVVSILYNSLDGLFHRNPAWLAGLPWYAEVAGAVLHGAPLAAVAYLVADLLLHIQPRDSSRRPAQLRALAMRLVRTLRTTRATLEERAATIARQAADLAQARAELEATKAQAARQAEDYAAGLRRQEQEIARLKEAAAQPSDPADLDRMAIARVLREASIPWRKCEELLRTPEATLRSRLKSMNGTHPVET